VARIAVVTPDVLSERMAGPAIRAFHIAQELSASHDVTLISTARCTISHPAFDCRAAAFTRSCPVERTSTSTARFSG
jgi:hypothetical protein